MRAAACALEHKNTKINNFRYTRDCTARCGSLLFDRALIKIEAAQNKVDGEAELPVAEENELRS